MGCTLPTECLSPVTIVYVLWPVSNNISVVDATSAAMVTVHLTYIFELRARALTPVKRYLSFP